MARNKENVEKVGVDSITKLAHELRDLLPHLMGSLDATKVSPEINAQYVVSRRGYPRAQVEQR